MTTETAIPPWAQSLLRAIEESPLTWGEYKWSHIDFGVWEPGFDDLIALLVCINDSRAPLKVRRELMRREVRKYLEEQGA